MVRLPRPPCRTTNLHAICRILWRGWHSIRYLSHSRGRRAGRRKSYDFKNVHHCAWGAAGQPRQAPGPNCAPDRSESSTLRKVGLSPQRGAHFEPDCSKSVLRGVTFVIGVAQSRPRGQNPRGKLGVPKCDTFINFYGCRSRRAAEDRLCPE